MNAFLAKLRLLVKEAFTKRTTYVAMLVASAGELRDQWGQIVDALPKWHWLQVLESHAYLVLGGLMVYARIRRAFREVRPEVLPPPVAR